MKKVLITGGEGYIGGRISRNFSNSGEFDVVITLNDASRVKTPSEIKTVPYDLTGDENLFEKVSDVDTLVHLASVNEIACSKNPRLALDVNTVGSFKLIQDAIKAGVKRIIYFSTAHVYGAPLEGHIDEKKATRSTHPYSYTHRAVEDYIYTAHDRGEIEGIVIRLSNGFGAPADPNVNRWSLLFSDLCKQAVENKKLVLKTSGLQKRDFITITNVANAVRFFINLDSDKIGDGLYNVGGKNSLQIYEVAKIIQERCEATLGYLPELVRPEPKPSEKPGELTYSIEKIESIGLKLEDNFSDEVDGLLQFCKNHFG